MSEPKDSKGDSKSQDDLSFADLLDNVKPLPGEQHNRADIHTPKPKPDPIPKETIKDEQRVLQESLEVSLEVEDLQPGDSLSFCRSGIQKSIFKKLKKGQYSIGAELDLHGYTRPEAQIALAKFIQLSREENIRCVRIIHGKGYGSNNQGPKLKPMVNTWLQQRNEILAFCSARQNDGGTGAVYVLLKSLR
ncbi:MAG: DNA mismatch repair protein MutS [Gammaproteobacteria bacterium]|nr:MAG: DNA mismatch repair protein MutS [Gammaproteobacteria bacterium]